MPDVNAKTHTYNAEAMALSGKLVLPVEQPIEPQAHSKLDPEGGYFAQRSGGFTLESVISFRSAYTHVSGSKSLKPGEGYNTLTTTVVEGLNVMEIVTADRVVGQTITEHPLDRYMPSITFLGTRIENLRIAGFPVALEWDYDIFGAKPVNDLPYAKDAGVISRVSRQYERILQNKNLSSAIKDHYNQLTSTLGVAETIECSLINRVAGLFPGTISGNVITIPGFGTITLGKLTVKHEDPVEAAKTHKKTTFTLTMIDLNMGCSAEGDVPVGGGTSNGSSYP
ncbi:MAG: hypothetical protein ABR991_00935 [Terracidiphilus sp.]|jgi:hypothetical protein